MWRRRGGGRLRGGGGGTRTGPRETKKKLSEEIIFSLIETGKISRGQCSRGKLQENGKLNFYHSVYNG